MLMPLPLEFGPAKAAFCNKLGIVARAQG
jgi:hypothetical protein